jgi:hypothetical protein
VSSRQGDDALPVTIEKRIRQDEEGVGTLRGQRREGTLIVAVPDLDEDRLGLQRARRLLRFSIVTANLLVDQLRRC